MATDDYDEEREYDLPDFSEQAVSPSADDVLGAPPSERRHLLEQHVRGVAEDLGIKLPEPRLAQASEVPPWERFGEPSASDEAVPAWGTVRQPVLRAKLCTPG